MNKTLSSAIAMVITLSLGAPAALAADTPAPEKPTPTEKKTGRKKRQLVCKDCGKPEKNCECKGEGHGEGDVHDHDAKKE